MKKIIIFSVLLVCSIPSLIGQDEIWYFGAGEDGLDFNTTPPTVISIPSPGGPPTGFYECSASISDGGGNLLFYTDGLRILNRNHAIMPNGNNLLGPNEPSGQTGSSSQGVIIVQDPGNSDRYYVLYSDCIHNNFGDGYRYSIVDMTLDGGNGDVVAGSKDLVILNGSSGNQSSEFLNAVCHQGVTWVVSHKVGSNEFMAHKIDATGIDLVPVVSPVGPAFTQLGHNRGTISFSHAGDQLAMASGGLGVYMFDFDVELGIVSNATTIDSGSQYYYGTEWSPDNTKIYFSRYVSGTGAGLAQYDLATTSIHSFPGRTLGSLRLAPDDKIYAAPGSPAGTALSVINNPNGLGAAANYVPDQQGGFSGGWILLGLPDNFLCNSVLTCEIDSVVQACTTDPSIQLTANPIGGTFGPASALYMDGDMFDPSKASISTPNLVTYNNGCDQPDSMYITVNECCPNIDPDLGGDVTVCDGKIQSLNAGAGYKTYQWIENGIVMGTETGATISADSGTYIVNVTNGDDCPGSDTIEIGNYAVPNPTITGDNFYCAGGDVVLDAGAGFDSYSWSPSGGTGQKDTVSSANTYTVTVENSDGCEGTADISITQKPLPSPTITGGNIVCQDSSTVLTGTAGSGGSLVWSDLTPFVTPRSITSAGTYTLTETDADGCSGSVDHIVTLESLPSVDIGDLYSICETQETQILDASTGTSSDTYLWNTLSTKDSIEVAIAGEYSVIVTSVNGCIAYDTADVSVNTLPSVDLGPSTFFCSGDSLTLDAGNGYSDYKWSTGDSVQVIYVNSPGPVSVVVTDANGCSGTSNVQVSANNVPSVELGGSVVVCEKDSITISAEHPDAFSYTWLPGNESESTIKVGSEDSTYTVTIVDSVGCEFTDSVQISEEKLPIVSIGDDIIICDNVTKVLEATSSSDVSYSWYLDRVLIPNEDAQTLEADSGEYIVTVSTENGCESSDTINVDNHQLPNVMIDSEYEFCQFDSVEIDLGSIAETYLWNTGDTTQSIWAYSAGAISVEVTDSNSCVVLGNTILIEHPLPAVDLGLNDSACVGLEIELHAQPTVGFGPYTFLWSDGATDPLYNLVGPDTLSVIVTNTKTNCTAYDTIEFAVLDSLEMLFDTLDHQVCEGAELDNPLNAGAFAGASYTWLLPDGATETTQEIVPLLNGWYIINVTDQYNCKGYDSVFNVVIPTPNINLGPDTSFCSLGSDTYTVTMEFHENVLGTISWNENNNNSNDSLFTARYTPSIVIGTFLDTSTGCVHVDSVELTEFCEPTVLQFPNIFMPGSDQGNGTFRPLGIVDDNFKDYVNNIVWSDFEVFNRWGLKVFQSSDILPNWDGIYENRPVASGVYYWVYKYKDSSLKEYTFNGFTQAIQTRD